MATATGKNSTVPDFMRGGTGVNNVICYSPMMISSNGLWQGLSPLDFSLPLFIIQISVIVTTTRILVFLLKPFQQPRVIAEIIAGIILGPSVMGRIKQWGDSVFPQRSLLTLETVAHLGLIYFLFLVGVEMDPAVIRRCGKRALAIAGTGMALPFSIGIGTAFIFRHQISKNEHHTPFLLFIALPLSVTAFPVLARILAEIKLLNSDIGRMAMSSGIANDICAWILLALAITISETHSSALASLWVLLSGIAFVLLNFFLVRPIMWRISRSMPDGESISAYQVCLILTGVMLAGAITDTIGIHSVFGAFVYGLAIPNSGPLGVALIDKLEDFVTGLFLPLFFAISGLRTNVGMVKNPTTVALLVLVFVLASIGKIVGTMVVAAFYTMPFSEGLALGFLMNTRGLIDMIVLNIGRDKDILDDESFAVMVLVSVAMTALVTPVVTSIHRPTRRLVGYKRRNLELSKPDAEMRLLACVHGPRNVPSIISLLDLTNPTKRSPIFVYALHLVELTGRASNMLVVHSSTASTSSNSRRTTSAFSSSPHIFSAFDSYEQHAGGVSIQPLTTVSPYSTMHEDVCFLAEDKHAAIIVLPFHKQQTVDGGLEPINPAIRQVNEKILASAPCSVAVLVDRGLSASASRTAVTIHAALLYFGGPDDREALAFASRMVENPSISLTVVRFRHTEDQQPAQTADATNDPGMITVVTDESYNRSIDENCMNQFRARNEGNSCITYVEMVVDNAEEVVASIRRMESIYQLYIVGRGYEQNSGSPLTAGLREWAECPELGPIGDVLVSSEFTKMVSVLVMQQYVTEGPAASSIPFQTNSNFTNDTANQRMSGTTPTNRGSPAAAFNISR